MAKYSKFLDKQAFSHNLEDFNVKKLLGTGGFGKVVLAEANDELYAIKIQEKKNLSVSMKRTNQVFTEVEILENVAHPFLVHCYSSFTTSQHLFIVMEYVSCGDLATRLKNCHHFDENLTIFYSREITLALEYLHCRNIIYRDLKPENILLDLEGHIKLTDFGLAVYLHDNCWESMCGTLDYLSPEAVLKKEYGLELDWWALGVLVYDMMYGYPPFCSNNPSQTLTNILHKSPTIHEYGSSGAKDFITKLLRKRREERLGFGSQGSLHIKTHEFFRNSDWNEVIEKKNPAPFLPILSAKDDTKYFEAEFTSHPIDGIQEIFKSEKTPV